MKVSVLASTALAAALALGALPAAAQTEGTSFYGNAGYTITDAGDGGNFGVVTGRIGARFLPYLGVEGEAGFGVDSDHVNVGNVRVKTELKHSFAAYGVGFLPVSPNFDLLARVGYGTTKIKASAAGVAADGSDESWNYGVGGQYLFDGVNGVRVDYTRHDFGHGGEDADTYAVSYVRKF